jgi:diadenosine tetraphosphate (Ap4A) HIT family hydrolase
MQHILKKFKFHENLIYEYQNWYLILREEQITFASMVLIEKKFKKRLSDLSLKSFKELKKIFNDIEKKIKPEIKYQKINYLYLMMVDKEVHMHIIPRYNKKILFENILFQDFGWPYPPKLDKNNTASKKIKKKIVNLIKKRL